MTDLERNSQHDLGKPDTLGLDQDMDVVGHQDVSLEAKPVALPGVLDPLDIELLLLVVVKSPLTLVAADNDMVTRSAKLDSRLSRHAPTLPVVRSLVKQINTQA